MLEKLKANIFFNKFLQRPDINKAYAMVQKSDSWYDTISTVHNSLKEILHMPHDEVQIKSDDGLILKGIYYKNNYNSDVTVICVHGYQSHAEREWAFPGLFYLSLGYNVLIPYQRAHGLSEGKYISLGGLEHLDILNWVKKVNEMNPNNKIIIHGLSMGGGIVLDLVDKEMKNVKCLISDAPTISIKNFFINVTKEVFKKNPEKIAFYAIRRYEKEFGVNIEQYEALDLLKNCKYPILLAAGSNENMDDVFERIKNINPNNTEIIILPGCSHGNGMYKQTELFQSTIKAFINKYID